MTLEESITGLLTVLVHPDNKKLENRLHNALRQFAETIAANAAGKSPEPKERGCPPMAHPGHCCCPNCRESCKPADELPKSVCEMIDTICHEHASIYLAPELQTLARLCLTIASRGRG